MSEIENKFNEKGYKVEFRKGDIVVYDNNNLEKSRISKEVTDDFGYEKDLEEVYNSIFNGEL